MNYLKIKRLLDMIISIVSLIILSPLFAVVAIIIKIDDKGKVFYKQIRVGKNEKNFNILKFRSMSENNDVYDFAKKDQITKIGKFLRNSSIDELPQLINIVKGEMSLIGPRPLLPEYFQYMTDMQKHRSDVLPGLTGLAQVNKDDIDGIIEKIDEDLKYVSTVSFAKDCEILRKTFKVVCRKKSPEGNKEGIIKEINELKQQHQLLNNSSEIKVIPRVSNEYIKSASLVRKRTLKK